MGLINLSIYDPFYPRGPTSSSFTDLARTAPPLHRCRVPRPPATDCNATTSACWIHSVRLPPDRSWPCFFAPWLQWKRARNGRAQAPRSTRGFYLLVWTISVTNITPSISYYKLFTFFLSETSLNLNKFSKNIVVFSTQNKLLKKYIQC